MDTPRPSPRTNRTRRVPHPVLIGHATSLLTADAPAAAAPAQRPARAGDAQVYKATADAEAGLEMYRRYTAVPDDMLLLRQVSVLTGHVSSFPPY